MHPPCRSSGFSLVEVVIAVGVFGVAVGAILGVLPLLTRQSSDSAEALVAQGIPDSIRVELTTLSARGFDALASSVPVMSTPLQGGFSWVASRSGEHVELLASATMRDRGAVAPADSFFLIEAWRFNGPPLAYANGGAVLPLFVRVSWPYRSGSDGSISDLASRSQFTFTIAIKR